MSHFDEPEIRRESESSHEQPGNGGSRPIGPLLIAIGVLAAVAALALLLLRREPEVPPGPAEEAPAVAAEAEPGELEPVAEAVEPDLVGDELVRRLIGALSSRPELAAWLANEDHVGRFVRVVGNVAFDENPVVHVPFLQPEERFAVRRDGEETVIDPTSHRRYDLLADVFVSLDEEGSSAALRRLEPELGRAWSELGYPGTFRQALDRAIDKLLAVPIVDGPVELEEGVVSWRFESARLEALAPAQKQLLRMGPDNVERIQEKLRRVRRELDAG